ncbi:hypothetical protein VTJ49DRAFT_7297 [Mycothermus thermophilus]|uniref:Uncharacterized protein n=1 Tax=Humicola insolens TaxID=85995 RepID=A0ABR3VHA7_HUMIN
MEITTESFSQNFISREHLTAPGLDEALTLCAGTLQTLVVTLDNSSASQPHLGRKGDLEQPSCPLVRCPNGPSESVKST